VLEEVRAVLGVETIELARRQGRQGLDEVLTLTRHETMKHGAVQWQFSDKQGGQQAKVDRLVSFGLDSHAAFRALITQKLHAISLDEIPLD
jgi:hypothetical protein